MLRVVVQVALVTCAVIAGALVGGVWLDQALGTRPWLTVGLLVGSIPVTTVALYYLAMSFAREQQAVGVRKRDILEEDRVDGFK
jgi:F0F1-type ATP synthase assembly protein I